MADDDTAWDEWNKLTDEEQEAVLALDLAKYCKWVGSMPFARRIAYSRGFTLKSCLRWRRLAKEFPFMREYLRKAQVRLLKLRIWRATGQYPGEA